ncbi:MAG: lipopolysaccharide biosynthesis protein [Phycisphaerae bacterium]
MNTPLHQPRDRNHAAAHGRGRNTARRRTLLTLADQATVSATNFATVVIVGKACAPTEPEQFGLYVLGLSLTFLVNEAHAALVSTPHTVTSPRLTGERQRAFNGSTLLHQFAVSAVLAVGFVCGAGLAWLLGRADIAGVLLTLSVVGAAIGLRNYARLFCFAVRRTGSAFTLDAATSLLQVALLLALWHAGGLHAWSALLVVGMANTVPAVLWLLPNLRHFSPRLAVARTDLLANWPLMRWVFVSGALWTLGMYLYPWAIEGLRDTAAVAAWGAAFTVANVGNPILLGLQNVVGPSIAFAWTEAATPADFRGYVLKAAGQFVAAMVPVALVLGLSASWLLGGLFGEPFAAYGTTVALLAAATVVQACGFTLSRGLFALGRADLDTLTNVAPLVVLLTAGVWLIVQHGPTGAAASLLIAQLAATTLRAGFFLSVTRRPATAPTLTRSVA